MAVHHPSRRCRKGRADILVNFDDLQPSDYMSSTKKQDSVIGSGNGSFGNFQICGKGVPRRYWMFCRGNKNDTRCFRVLWIPALADSECYGPESSDLRMSCFFNKVLVNIGGHLAKLVPGRVSTEVDARLAYDTHAIIRKFEFWVLVLVQAGLSSLRYKMLAVKINSMEGKLVKVKNLKVLGTQGWALMHA